MLRKLIDLWRPGAAGATPARTRFADWLATVPPPPAPDEPPLDTLRAALRCGLTGTAVTGLEKLAPESADASRILAEHYARTGRFEQALPHAERCAAGGALPDLLLLVHCLIKLGRHDEARTRLDQAPDSPEVRSDLRLTAANLSRGSWADYLEPLNAIYADAGLSPIAALQPDQPPRFGDFTATADPVDDPDNKVSILVPAYNAEPLLAFALESLLAQSWRNIEVIVVDDCSTDRTGAIAKEIAARDPRVVVYKHAENRGAYPARNTALRRATGRFVTVHDADDWAHPQKIEIQVRHFLKTGAPIVTTSAIRVLEDMSVNFRAPQRTHILMSFPSIMIERELVTEVNGWDRVRMGADAELMARMSALLGAKPSNPLPDVPLSFMLSTPTSLTGRSLTGLDSISYGARKQYIDAYKAWHKTLEGQPLARGKVFNEKRPFPAPNVFFHRDAVVEVDEIFVFDFGDKFAADISYVFRRKQAEGVRIGLVHWPRLRDGMVNFPTSVIKQFIAAHAPAVIVPGEKAVAKSVTVWSPALLRAWPESLPEIEAETFTFLRES